MIKNLKKGSEPVMAEAIITRATGEPETIVPITPGYHTILATLRDPDGRLLVNYPLNCKDGGLWYNYSTNSKGQTIFTCNSGAANIYFLNNSSGVHYLDMNSCWTNIDAPVGLSTKININVPYGNTFYEFTSNKVFAFIANRTCNVTLVGGGGGGGSEAACSSDYSDDGELHVVGGGGGAGYLNNYNSQILQGTYNFIRGAGGAGGYFGQSYYGRDHNNGNAGGTSYIVNTSMSATGGAGGQATWTTDAKGGKGGLGNGGSSGSAGKNSSVDFAGGGGGGGGTGRGSGGNAGNGGSPYGGKGGWGSGTNTSINKPTNGSRGGGGGGGRHGEYKYGGWGGSGLMRINIKY